MQLKETFMFFIFIGNILIKTSPTTVIKCMHPIKKKEFKSRHFRELQKKLKKASIFSFKR